MKHSAMPFLIRGALAALLLAGLRENAAADWLHYRGPLMRGASTEKLPATLPENPRIAWKASLGIGTSGITVAGDRVFSMGNAGGKDSVFCFDAKTGKQIWRHQYPLALDKRMFEGGTAATPTLDGDRVYTVSHQGDLFCLDAATGKPRWYQHHQKDLGGRRPQWGYAGSPTIAGTLLLLDVGGDGSSTVALDKLTGKTVWKSGSDDAGYASIVPATIDGKKTAVVFKSNALLGLDSADGRELWRFPWKTDYGVNAATPLILGDRVFLSSGYGTGCAMLQIKGGHATPLWKNKNLHAHINTPIETGGHIYGIDGQAEPKAPLVCLDAATGSIAFTDTTVSGGSLILVDGRLIVLSEKGELLIAPASPTGFKPVVRAQILGGRCWVQPTYSGGRLFAKNNAGDLVCIALGE